MANSLFAASGTWTADANGNWSDTSKWSGGIVADGSGNTAFFGTLNITADRTVNFDGNHTLTKLSFSDTSGTSSWTLTNNGASVLTLAASSTIAVTNVATIAVPMSVGATFSKTGPGTLILAASNTWASTWSYGVAGGDALGPIQLANSGALGAGSAAYIVALPGSATAVSRLELSNNIEIDNKAITINGRTAANPFLSNISGTNVWNGTITITGTGGNYYVNSSSGLLTLAGTIKNSIATSARGLTTLGAGNGIISGNIVDGSATALTTIAMNATATGTWTLAGTNTYTGSTVISGGKLYTTTLSTGGGTFTNASGTTLGITVANPGDTLNMNALAATGAATLDLKNVASTTVPVINATNLALGGTVTIKISSGTFTAGQTYPLISYTSRSGASTFALGSLPAGVTGNIVDPSANPVVLQITGVPVVWNGNVSPAWDINATANWKVNGVPGSHYVDGVGVAFDDTLSGSSAITLNAIVAPATVGFGNSVSNYSITGSGKITGSANLVKNGTGLLVLDTDNDYSGGTTLAGGTLQIGANDTHGAIGAGDVVVTGASTIAFNRTDSLSIGNAYSSGGNPSFVVNAGSLTLTGAVDNAGAGAVIQSGATLILAKDSSSAAHALGSSGATISANGLLKLAGTGGDQLYSHAIVTDNGVFDVAGQSEGFDRLAGNGLVTNSAATSVTLEVGENNGTSTFAGIIADNASGPLSLNKAGTNTITLTGTNTYKGVTTVVAGKLVVNVPSKGGGDYAVSNGILSVVANANAQIPVNNFILSASGASTIEFQNLTSTTVAPVSATNITLNGTVAVNITGGSLIQGQNYPLITFSSLTVNSGSFVLGTVPAGVSVSLQTLANSVVLTVIGTPEVWNGNVSGAWNINSAANWKSPAGVTGLTYNDGSGVTFDDTLAGTPSITLNTVVQPASVVFNNTTNAYSISGTGKISGGTALTKTGTNALILLTDNDYTNTTTLAGGTLQIGNGGVHGSFGLGDVIVTGTSTITFNRTDSLSVGNIRASGANPNLIINSGTVSLTGSTDNSSAGATIQSGAMLILAKDSGASAHGLGSVGATINPNGILQLAGTGGDQIYANAIVTDNGIFDLTGQSEGFDRLAGNGLITNSVATQVLLQLGENNGSSTFGGTITETAGGNVGVNKIGTGTLTLTGTNNYTGTTTVTAGKIVTTTANTGGGDYNVQYGQALGVNVTKLNGSLVMNSLTYNGPGTSELQNISSTTTPAITVIGAFQTFGTLTVNILSGTFAAGQDYPLYSSGSFYAQNVVLGTLPAGITATIDATVNPVVLHVLTAPVTWNGNLSGAWDINTTANWKSGATTGLVYQDMSENPTFDDTLTGTSQVTLNTTVSPGNILFNNNLTNYSVTGTGKITGSAGLTKNGSASLNLGNGGGNDFTGSIVVNGGTLIASAAGALPSTAGLQLAGDANGAGSLSLPASSQVISNFVAGTTNSATTNRLNIGAGQTFTVSSGNLTIGVDNSSATVTNIPTQFVAAGGGNLVYQNPNGTVQIGGVVVGTMYNSALADWSGLASFTATANILRVGDPAGAFVLAGSSTLLLPTNNAMLVTNFYVGNAAHGSGTVQFLKLGAGTNLIESDTIYVGYGLGNSSRSGGDVRFAGSSGSVVIRDTAGSTNATLRVGGLNGGNTSGTPAGTVDLTGHNADIALGVLSLGERETTAGTGGSTGTFSFDTGTLSANTVFVATRGGTLTGDPVTGTLNLGGGTVNIGAGGLTIASNALASGSVVGIVNILGGTVTLGADIMKGTTVASTLGTLTLNGGTLDLQGHQIGGANHINTLNFLSGTLQNVGEINAGASSLTKTGNGTLLVRGNNTYSGGTTVSAGVLGGNGAVSSAVTVQSTGTLQPGLGGTNTGTLTINNNLTLGGVALMTLDRTNAQTASKVTGIATLNLGGSLVVTNMGPALQVGDTFTLFAAGSTTGSFASVVLPAGYVWTNNIAGNGTVAVLSIAPAVNLTPTNIVASLTGSTLSLKWPQDHTGWTIQSNSVSLQTPANWHDITGSQTTNALNIPVNPSTPNVFYRMRY